MRSLPVPCCLEESCLDEQPEALCKMIWRALIVLVALQLHYSMSAVAAEPAAILGRGASGVSEQTNDDAETVAVAEVFEQLTEEEKEDAAKSSSYRYLKAARCSKDQRDKLAKAMILRYVHTEHVLGTKQSQWTARSLSKIRSTIEYRSVVCTARVLSSHLICDSLSSTRAP